MVKEGVFSSAVSEKGYLDSSLRLLTMCKQAVFSTFQKGPPLLGCPSHESAVSMVLSSAEEISSDKFRMCSVFTMLPRGSRP